MTRATSFFLDALRLVAALVVFSAHTTNYWNPRLQDAMQGWAHDAVIVFFVLSGFVIAHSTREGSRDARLYTVARLSRLYSVVAPALLFTALLRLVGRALDPGIYAHYERSQPLLCFAASGLFLNEVWSLEISPPTNTPFWSLGYEFWYYVFFGVVLFVKSPRLKGLALVAGALVAGPKVMMLLPVWLVGVAAYRWRDAVHLSRRAAVIGLVVSAAVTVLTLCALPDWPEKPGVRPWFFSGAAGTDFLNGLGWGAVIWFFNQAWEGREWPDWICRPVRWLAGRTFSLYLYHAPLVILATALFPPPLLNPLGKTVLLSTILLVVAGLAACTEAQRFRWRRWFDRVWERALSRPA
jgi:peptidoglycan/LPS O-acetylase OafA/YrhL